MKKILPIFLAIIMAVSFCACSGNNDEETENSGVQATAKMQTVLDPTEYVLYQNIFYNDQGADYENKTITKRGVFSTLYDKFNDKTRYYVWGYNDQTKCCDYQWEINITGNDPLPENGSLVKVEGTFASNENSLDGYWIENPKITVESKYESEKKFDIDMTTMDATLERVQIINMQQFSQDFEGKTVRAYGRISASNCIQHPYYDGAFTQIFESKDEIPAIGSVVIVEGVYSNGIITDATIEVTNDF